MSRFFFDYFDGEKTWEDSQGAECTDLNDATQRAVDSLTAFVRTSFSARAGGSHAWIDVKDARRVSLQRIEIKLTVAVIG